MENSFSEDEKTRINHLDNEYNVFISTDNKNSFRIEGCHFSPDVRDSNLKEFEIKPGKSTESEISVE